MIRIKNDTYIYIQEFDDGEIRYGITNNLERRINEHQSDYGDAFTLNLMVPRPVKRTTARTIEALLIQKAFDNDIPCKNNYVENKRYLFKNKDYLDSCPICEEIGCNISPEYINQLIEEHKEKEQEYMKAWREANKEKIKEYKKTYHEANKEKIKEYKKAWAEANKEKRKEYIKAWYEANKARKKEYDKAWYEANKARKKEYDKAWREANKEKIKEYKKTYHEDNKERLKEYKKAHYLRTQGLYTKKRNQFWTQHQGD